MIIKYLLWKEYALKGLIRPSFHSGRPYRLINSAIFTKSFTKRFESCSLFLRTSFCPILPRLSVSNSCLILNFSKMAHWKCPNSPVRPPMFAFFPQAASIRIYYWKYSDTITFRWRRRSEKSNCRKIGIYRNPILSQKKKSEQRIRRAGQEGGLQRKCWLIWPLDSKVSGTIFYLPVKYLFSIRKIWHHFSGPSHNLYRTTLHTLSPC